MTTVSKNSPTVNLVAEPCTCYDHYTVDDWANYVPCPHRQDLQRLFRRQAEQQFIEDLAS
jgi:hypothetical protein